MDVVGYPATQVRAGARRTQTWHLLALYPGYPAPRVRAVARRMRTWNLPALYPGVSCVAVAVAAIGTRPRLRPHSVESLTGCSVPLTVSFRESPDTQGFARCLSDQQNLAAGDMHAGGNHKEAQGTNRPLSPKPRTAFHPASWSTRATFRRPGWGQRLGPPLTLQVLRAGYRAPGLGVRPPHPRPGLPVDSSDAKLLWPNWGPVSCFQHILPTPLPAQGPNGGLPGTEVSPTVRGHKPGPAGQTWPLLGFVWPMLGLKFRWEYPQVGSVLSFAPLPSTLYCSPLGALHSFKFPAWPMGNPSTMTTARRWHFLRGPLGAVAGAPVPQELGNYSWQEGPGPGTRAFP